VGTFAVQIAKAFGAEVTGVCSTAKTDLVRAVGADHVIDYTRGDFAAGRRRYDAVIDIGGNRRLSHLRRALTPNGTLVITGGNPRRGSALHQLVRSPGTGTDRGLDAVIVGHALRGSVVGGSTMTSVAAAPSGAPVARLEPGTSLEL
jgi:NADPH:quinone reductase-like Zn-dependent oxidoreductase